MNLNINIRPRRNRRTQNLRNLVAETHLEPSQLVYPFFLIEGKKQKIPIKTMPGQFRWSFDELLTEIERAIDLGIKSFALFPAIEDSKKNSQATEALNPKGLIPQAIQKIKKEFREILIFADVALDPYSSDGHDGLVENGLIINDASVNVLTKMSVVLAEAGADFVAPSDMMDGRIKAIRLGLDQAGFSETGILSYAVKYASGFYGPFRDALDSAPKFGDKKTYQMDPRNVKEALREAKLDISEGADIIMVKPALSYLDVIRVVRDQCQLPLAAYNVSGEFAMIKAAAAQGMLDEARCRDEMLISIKRAGADIIFTYFALEFAENLSNSKR